MVQSHITNRVKLSSNNVKSPWAVTKTYLSHIARHLGPTRRMTQTDGTRSTTAHPAAEGVLVPSDGDDPRDSASRRAAAKATATDRDVGSVQRCRPSDEVAIPPETGGDDEQTNDGGRRVAAPRRDGGNRLARGRFANPRDVATPCHRPLRYPMADGVPAGRQTNARSERHLRAYVQRRRSALWRSSP